MYNHSYLEAVKADVITAIQEDYDLSAFCSREEAEEKLYDALWIDDSVTGNGSGSHFFSRAKARESVIADMETVTEALREFCCSPEEIGRRFLAEDWEWMDVVARCYVLSQAVSEALDELWQEGEQ